jgi:hypothetical protein
LPNFCVDFNLVHRRDLLQRKIPDKIKFSILDKLVGINKANYITYVNRDQSLIATAYSLIITMIFPPTYLVTEVKEERIDIIQITCLIDVPTILNQYHKSLTR